MKKSKKKSLKKKAVAISEVKGKKAKTSLQNMKSEIDKTLKTLKKTPTPKTSYVMPKEQTIEEKETPVVAPEPEISKEVVHEQEDTSVVSEQDTLPAISEPEPEPIEISMIEDKTTKPARTQKSPKADAQFYFGIEDGEQDLVGQPGSVLNITDFGAPDYSAIDWYLVVDEMEVISLENKIGRAIKLPDNINHGILVGPSGYRLDFSNLNKITVTKEGAKAPKSGENNHLFLMGVEAPATGWFVFVKSAKVINLAEADDFIVLNPENSGILIGPEGARLNFSKISAIKLPPKRSSSFFG